MKRSFSILVVIFVSLITFSSCDNGKNCSCTSTFTGTGSAGMADEINVHTPFDKTSNPDCSVYEGTTTDAEGLITTITCVTE